MKSGTILCMLVGLLLTGCRPTADDRAQAALQQIEQLYVEGRYQAALDSIGSLRAPHPQAVDTRKKALRLWRRLRSG